MFLQDGRHISPWHNGLWVLPSGLFVIVGAQLGGRLIHRFGTIQVVRIGLVIYEVGLLFMLHAISLAHHGAATCCPGSRSTASGIGFALAQLTNVVLSEIPPEGSGVASGANTTVRQVGSALGVAVIGTVLTVQTVSHAVQRIKAAALPAALKAQALAGVHALGSGYAPPSSREPRRRGRRPRRGRAGRRCTARASRSCSRSSWSAIGLVALAAHPEHARPSPATRAVTAPTASSRSSRSTRIPRCFTDARATCVRS